MHFFYMLGKLYPFLALSFTIALFPMGMYFRRRKSKVQWGIWGMIGVLGITSLLWLIFRGDVHSDQWVRSIIGV